jgi:uncharacterized protein (TIGR03000 family)
MREWLIRSRVSRSLPVLAAGAALAAATAFAGGPPPGIPSGVMPWEYGKYLNAKRPPVHGSDTPGPPAAVTQTPRTYKLHVTRLEQKHAHDDPNVVFLVAHLPDEAELRIEGQLTRDRGALRTFISPSLTPGRDYLYTVEARWLEDGKWVSQTHSFPVRAGDTHCIDLIGTDTPGLEKEVEEALAKLTPGEQKAAKAQRFCAVQTGIRLGSMGKPVKLAVNGKDVFLCCEGCVAAAKKAPERTAEEAQKLKAKASPQS